MVKVSVIVPTYQRCNSVKRLLLALDNQSFPPSDFETIISIDGSTDGTREMVQALAVSYNLRYLWNPNSGRATACNKGIQDAQGAVLIILDDDMEPAPEFVEAHYTENKNRENIVVVGTAPITINDLSTSVIRFIGNKFNSHLRKISQPGYIMNIRDFYSGNFSARSRLLIETGLYNENFKIYGNEDVELAHRFLENQISVIFSNKALAKQHYEKDLSGLAKDTVSKGRTAVQLVNIYPDIFPELKLIEYNFPGWKWRSLRAFLISVSLLFPGTKDIIVRMMQVLEKVIPSKTEYLYRLALDYFFWLGVWIEIKKNDENNELESRIKTYNKI